MSPPENSITQFNDDSEIVDRILKGEIELFETIEKRYRKPIERLVCRMVRTFEDAEDIVQETFIKAFANLNRFRKEYSFLSWLFKIASNLCIDYLRRKRINLVSLTNPKPSDDSEAFFDLPSGDVTPDWGLVEQERKKLLYKAIEDLPENYRNIINMRHFEELDYREIAERLNIPIGTVKAQIFRARKMLLEKLKAYQNLFLSDS